MNKQSQNVREVNQPAAIALVALVVVVIVALGWYMINRAPTPVKAAPTGPTPSFAAPVMQRGGEGGAAQQPDRPKVD